MAPPKKPFWRDVSSVRSVRGCLPASCYITCVWSDRDYRQFAVLVGERRKMRCMTCDVWRVTQWCAQDERCHRLQLPDLLISPMQHCTKVPLLLHNISRYTLDPVEQQMLSESLRTLEASLGTPYYFAACQIYAENFITNQSVKEFWKSVHICQSK